MIVMNQDFFQGYRKTAVKPDEIMVSILMPYTKQVASHSVQADKVTQISQVTQISKSVVFFYLHGM